jgi:hypothetical protein
LLPSEPIIGEPQGTPCSFQIQKPDGAPCPSLPVQYRFSIRPDRWENITSDAQGRFSLTLPRFPKSWNQLFFLMGENPILVSETVAQTSGNILVYEKPAGAAIVRGVALRNGAPVEKRRVLLTPRDDRAAELPVYVEDTNGAGRFVMKNIPAGKYLLTIGAADGQPANQGIRMQEIDLSESVDRFVQFDLQGVNLTGGVFNCGGEPMSGAEVRIGFPITLNERQQCAVEQSLNRSVIANAHGVFTFDHLQAGEYEIQASRYSHGVSQKQRVVISGADIEGLKLELQ